MKIKFTGIKGVGSKIHRSSTNVINAVYSIIKNERRSTKINIGVRKPSYFTFIIDVGRDADDIANILKYLLSDQFLADLEDKLIHGGSSPFPIIGEIADVSIIKNDCIININLSNLNYLGLSDVGEFSNKFSSIVSPDKYKVTGENIFAIFSNRVEIDVLSGIVDLLNNSNRNTREGEFASISLSYMDDSVHIVSGSCYPTIHSQIKNSIEKLHNEHLRTSNV